MEQIAKEYSLLLLAGGKSSRMGQDKGDLIYKGKSFVDTLLEKGQQMGISKIFLSGHECSRSDVSIVQDEYKECGPLGGLQACMKVMDTSYCLVLPVDVPQIPVNVLKALLDAHRRMREQGAEENILIVKHGDHEEPLIGIYAVDLMERIEEEIKAGRYAVFRLIKKIGYQVIEIDIEDWKIDNINTPQSYERLLGVSKCEQK